MKIRSDMRLGRLPSGVVVFEHSFGLAIADWVFVPYCTCGWIGTNIAGMTREERAEAAQESWKMHLVIKNVKDSR